MWIRNRYDRLTKFEFEHQLEHQNQMRAVGTLKYYTLGHPIHAPNNISRAMS